eukprot:scaffold4841_cov121-Isochrysis_galbana.AAC.16
MSDDDWETDPDWECTLTDAERRRVGCAAAAEGLRRDRETGRATQLSQAFSRGLLTETNQEFSPAGPGAAKSSASQRHVIGPDAVVRLAESRAAAEKRTAEQVASRKAETAAAVKVRLAAEIARPQLAACPKSDENGVAISGVLQPRMAAMNWDSVSGRSDLDTSAAEERAERASRAQWRMAQKVAVAAGRDEALRKAAAYRAAAQKSTPTRMAAHRCGALASPTPSEGMPGQAMKQVVERATLASKAMKTAGSQCYSANQPDIRREAADSSVSTGRRLADECPTPDADAEKKVVAERQECKSAAAHLTTSVAPNAPAPNSIDILHVTAAMQLTEQVAAENAVKSTIAAALKDVSMRGAAAEMESAARVAPAFMDGIEPPVGLESAQPVSMLQLLVGSRLLALAPDGEAATWVPARVIAERTVGRTTQYKVSLDGYDSETDEWLEPQSHKVRPHTVVADAKEAAAQGKREADTARRRAEGRRAEGYELHHHAMRHGEEPT